MDFTDEKKDYKKDVSSRRQELHYFYFLNRMSLLSKPLDIRTKKREIARLLTKENAEKKYEGEVSCC